MRHNIKTIADAHIKARKTNVFLDVPVKNRREVIVALYNGYTFEHILTQIEVGYCNPISIFIMKYFKYATIGYKIGLYDGFEKLLLNK